jgi:hypothetical protein
VHLHSYSPVKAVNSRPPASYLLPLVFGHAVRLRCLRCLAFLCPVSWVVDLYLRSPSSIFLCLGRRKAVLQVYTINTKTQWNRKEVKMASLYAVPYNGTGETGCDSLTENCNIYYEVRFSPPLTPTSCKKANTHSPAT